MFTYLLSLFIFINGIGVSYMETPNGPIGWGQKDKYDCKHFSVMVDMNVIEKDNFRLFVEGGLNYNDFNKHNNTASADLLLFIEKTFPKNFYLEFGTGASYWSDSPSKDLLKRDLIATVKYGCGLKNGNWKVGYRFAHYSSLFQSDPGCNQHGMIIQYLW